MGHCLLLPVISYLFSVGQTLNYIFFFFGLQAHHRCTCTHTTTPHLDRRKALLTYQLSSIG